MINFIMGRGHMTDPRPLSDEAQRVVDYHLRDAPPRDSAARVAAVIDDLRHERLDPRLVSDLADAVAHALYLSGAPPRERVV